MGGSRGRGSAAVLVCLATAVLALSAVASPAAGAQESAADVTDAAWQAGAAEAPPAAGAGIPFRFVVYPFELRRLELPSRAFSNSRVVPRVDTGLHDAEGVRMRRVKGRLYEFPRGQASYGLENLNAYRITGDAFFLERALAQARRLVSYHTEAAGAWYYPNYPSRQRHGRPGEYVRAPYYSALPQGRILMFFSRLAEMTGSPRWREAADHTFLAFLRPGPCSGPYVVRVDARGYYWLEEWPWAGMKPDATLNGHNSSAFGLYEYHMVTGDERAAELFKGAATTIRHYLPRFRNPGWVSCCCLAHRHPNAHYHAMHVGQLLQLYKLTGDLVFARAADSFSHDYPRPGVSGRLRVEPGVCRAVRIDAAGTPVARRTVTLRRGVTWRTDCRRRLWRGSPVYLRVRSGGTLAGWWLQERPGRAFLIGTAAARSYAPPRRLSVAAGVSLQALAFDENGRVRASRRVSSADGLRFTVNRRAVINGYDRVRISAGDLERFWVRLRSGVRLY